MIVALLVLGGLLQMSAAAGPTNRMPLHVRVHAVGSVERSTIQRALDVVGRLLASAGIELVWRLCDTPQTCERHTRPPGEIAVVVSAEKLPSRHERCGQALMGSRLGEGYIRVSEPCLAPAVERFLISRGWPPLEQLQRDTHDDLLGAVVAHELGHLLGLEHDRGVMQALLDSNDIHALRLRTLAFSASQSARMRALLAERTGEALTGGRTP
jgi:hypothetical protein